MSKKTLKKIEHLRKLQSLYRTEGAAAASPLIATAAPVSNNTVIDTKHHLSVASDLRYLGLVLVVMFAILLGLNWAVHNTNIDESIIATVKSAL